MCAISRYARQIFTMNIFRGYILILFTRLLLLQLNGRDSDLVVVPIIIRTRLKSSWRAKLKRILMRWIIKIQNNFSFHLYCI